MKGEPRPSMVQLMSDLFKEHPKLVMLVTPEGTRAKQEQWKQVFTMLQLVQVFRLRWPIWTMRRKKLEWVNYLSYW